MNMTKKLYILGDGLKKGNQLMRAKERDAVLDIGGYTIYNPWDNAEINDKSRNPTAEMIFEKDMDAILRSDVIIADVDDDSRGSICEVGAIWGINYIVKQLKQAVQKANREETNEDDFNHHLAQSVKALLEAIPEKETYWHSTDIRHTNIPESGMRRSFSLNQFVHGCLLDLSGEEKTFEEILEILKASGK